VFVEENLSLSKLLNFCLPQFPSCISIYSIVYVLYGYTYTHTPAMRGIVVFEAYVFIFLYRFHWANEDLSYRKVKGFAPQKVNGKLNNQSQTTGVLMTLPHPHCHPSS